MPSYIDLILAILVSCVVFVIGLLIDKVNEKFGNVAVGLLSLIVIGYLFYEYSFPDMLIYFGLMAFSYSTLMGFTDSFIPYKKVREELALKQVELITLQKDVKRILIDILIFLIVFLFAGLFLIYGPKESILKYFILIGFISYFSKLIKRILIYQNITCYYCAEEDYVYIVSKYELRKFSIKDCQSVQVESNVDILKLHPLLTLFMSNIDFTTSNEQILKVSLPGETIYLTVENIDKWKQIFTTSASEKHDDLIKVLPFYHRKNLKRLVGKLYFATTVKGVSAYSAMLLLLYFLDIPTWALIVIAVAFWLMNLIISDLVLKVAMDAKEINNPTLCSTAETIFKRAGISNVKIYETESAEYNGLATGMNIGRAMITLTTATLKLPIETIEGIIAHEAIHVKKRDVLWSQIWRVFFILFVLIIIFALKDHLMNTQIDQIILFFIIWFLMILFPIFQSFVSQWMEVRADHLGSSLLTGGNNQMATSLRTLTSVQDKEIHKTIEYKMLETGEKDNQSSLEREESWLLRLIGFQYMPHPPMYWRVQMLSLNKDGWGKWIFKRWLIDRCKELLLRK